MTTATIYEARTNLSELIRVVQAGETVVITSGREKKPVAKLEPMVEQPPKRLGVAYKPSFELPAFLWEPLTDEECGCTDDPLRQLGANIPK